MDGFVQFIIAMGQFMAALVSGAGAVVGALWSALEDYPQVQVLLVVVLIGLFVYWFADGVRNWRRKCWPCRGKGAFDSKINERLNRACSCCKDSRAGAGRHPTVRSRIWDQIRGTKH